MKTSTQRRNATLVLLVIGLAALVFLLEDSGPEQTPAAKEPSAVTDAAPANTTPAPDNRVATVHELLANAARQGASGVLRISINDEVLVETGFGSAACERDEPVTPRHLFMIGSITKELTQVLAFVLEERGVFSLDDSVGDLLQEFDGPIGQVTLRQLIHHTGGVPDLIDADGQPVPYSIDYDYEHIDRDEMLRRAALAQLQSAPGEVEEYSNLGFQLLAAIFEVRTGERYPDLLRRYIYGPAGMTDTDFWFRDRKRRLYAEGCLKGGSRWGNPIADSRWDPEGPSWNLMGAGGLLSTADSLSRFFSGIRDGVYFQTRAQFEAYKASRLAFSKRLQQRIMGPAGSNGIFWAVAYWAEDIDFNAVLMTNRADHPAEGDLFRDVVLTFTPESLGIQSQQAQ